MTMKSLVQSILIAAFMNFILFFFTALAADSTSAAIKTYATLDSSFVKQYDANSQKIGKNIRPLLVVNGFLYQLYLKDGTIKTMNGIISPFNELKAISHIGPCLYSILSPAWLEPNDYTWKKNLTNYQKQIKAALQQVNQIDWSNPEWPNDKMKLQQFMQDSLQMVDSFITITLQKGSITKQDFQEFAQHYIHTMVATMYLAQVANVPGIVRQVNTWKSELGSQWDDLYVVIIGSKGGYTSELSPETNTVFQLISKLMNPQKVKTNISVMPTVSTLKVAEKGAGSITQLREFADIVFTTPRAKEVSGFDKDIQAGMLAPLAIQDELHIISQDLMNGKITFPAMEILPKDKTYMEEMK